MSYAKDLTNMRFGRLFVLCRNFKKQIETQKTKGVYRAYWDCRCDCGKIVTVASCNLLNKSNPTMSCGCLAKERQKLQKNTKENRWSFRDNIAIGMDSNGNTFLIDQEDYKNVKKYCWRVDKRGYVVSNSRNGRNKTLFIHRIIMNAPTNMFVDHKNWNKSDNRKENLRIATKSQNNINIQRKSNNTSGYPGVTKTKSGKYISRISINKNRFYLGTYDNLIDAIISRRKAEIYLHKEWSGENNKRDYEKILKELKGDLQ